MRIYMYSCISNKVTAYLMSNFTLVWLTVDWGKRVWVSAKVGESWQGGRMLRKWEILVDIISEHSLIMKDYCWILLCCSRNNNLIMGCWFLTMWHRSHNIPDDLQLSSRSKRNRDLSLWLIPFISAPFVCWCCCLLSHICCLLVTQFWWSLYKIESWRYFTSRQLPPQVILLYKTMGYLHFYHSANEVWLVSIILLVLLCSPTPNLKQWMTFSVVESVASHEHEWRSVLVVM